MTENPKLKSDVSSGLFWVKGELAQSFDRIRGAIETYLDEPGDDTPLSACLNEITEFASVASVVQCYSATLLADEMRTTVEAMLANTAADGEAAMGALIRATLRLADFVELLARGEADHAAVFSQEINDLRSSRGEPEISHAGLFVRFLRLRAPTIAPPGEPRKAGLSQALARKHFSVLRQAVSQYSAGQQGARALALLGKAADQFASVVATPAGYQFWWVTSAFLEAIAARRDDHHAESVKLLTRMLQVTKALAEKGEAAVGAPMSDLSGYLLFTILRAPVSGPHVAAVQAGFQIDRDVVSEERLAHLRERMQRPNVESLTSVARELRTELNEIKDAIDLAVRSGDIDEESMAGTRERVGRVAATLSVLGLDAEAELTAEQAERLAELAAAGDPENPRWMGVAEAMLKVEQQLENQLFERAGGDAPAADAGQHQDLREGVDAVLRESLVDLARVKTDVNRYISSGDGAHLETAFNLLGGIRSGVQMLGIDAAVELIGRLADFVASPAMRGVGQDAGQADRFADAVACIEYFIEARQENQPHTERLLVDLEGYLDRMEAGAGEAAPAAAAEAAADTGAVDDIDPEFREIFIEEAGEVLAELEQGLPSWRNDPGDADKLGAVRRAFHTLKGSGRMVGAQDIGEFGWALENLLNRCLDGGLGVGADIVDVVSDAVAMLPKIIEQFSAGRAAGEEMHALIARAERLTGGEESAEFEETGPDAELFGMFLQDAGEHVEKLRSRLAQDTEAELEVDEDLVRGLHTLRGSAAAVGLETIRVFSEEMESLTASARLAQQRLPRELMQNATDAYGNLLTAAAEGAESPDVSAVRAAIRAQQARLPTASDDLMIDRELIEIFTEEAADLLDEAERELTEWRKQPGSQQAASSLQRIFHTLKGSARTASATAIGDVGAALDAAMKSCMEGDLAADESLFGRVDGAIAGLFALLDEFRNGVNGDSAPVLAAFAGAEPAFAAEAGPGSQTARPAFEATPPQAEGQSVPADQWPPDPAILEIFLAEGEELLESVDSNFNAWESSPQATGPLRDLQRDLHTLKGSARMAGLHGFGAVAHEMESLIAAVERSGQAPAADVFGRLHHATDGLFHMLDEVKSGQAPVGAERLVEDLRAELTEAAPTAPLAESASPELPAPAAAVAADESAPGAGLYAPEGDLGLVETAADEGGEDLVTAPGGEEPAGQALDAAGGAFEYEAQPSPDAADAVLDLSSADEALDFSIADEAAEPAAEVPAEGGAGTGAEFVGEDTDDLAPPPEAGLVGESTDDLGPAPGAAFAADPEPAASAEPAVEFVDESLAEAPFEDEADEDEAAIAIAPQFEEGAHAELVEIFLPEAAELLESYDQTAARWMAAPESDEAIGELLRVLHTLKGGARMAGLIAMGDIAHNLEGRLEKMQEQSVHPEASFFDDLRQTSDRLHALRDEARVFFEQAQAEASARQGSGWADSLLWKPPEDDRLAAMRRETARVTVEQLDGMLNEAGEISIYRSRLDEQASGLRLQLREVEQTIVRIRDQLRMLENETESQIQARSQGVATTEHDDRYGEEFDPLEMDRYSRMQELTRALSESVTDLSSLHTIMGDVVSETETLLLQQGRVNTSVQQGLMSTLMVPFSRQVQRLQRVQRQTANDHAKQVQLSFSGIEAELDRNVLERMTPMLEHIIRNCVIHGIETATERVAAGKPATGTIVVNLHREGSMLAIELRDDGRGLDYEKIRATALKRGMISADTVVSERDLARFIFEPGFSTAETLTKDAGRGVGMDVVTSQVKQLGGSLDVGSVTGQGARFIIRLPLSLALAQALLVQVGHELYALPLATIEGIARIPVADLERYRSGEELFRYGETDYRVEHLAPMLDLDVAHELFSSHMPVILAKAGEGIDDEQRVAIVVDALLGSRELVTKTAGPQVSTVTGVSGATILADGRVVLILDIQALLQERLREERGIESIVPVAVPTAASAQPLVMVIDDSITMRRVAERLLERNGYRVGTAKDGVDAMAKLQTESPDILLLDIEMPKADGFEVATFVRNNERLQGVPIIMITSRSGDKHRERAAAIGVNSYMIKPYQEKELIEEIGRLLGVDQGALTIH